MENEIGFCLIAIDYLHIGSTGVVTNCHWIFLEMKEEKRKEKNIVG
jgi:hypothetical protein